MIMFQAIRKVEAGGHELQDCVEVIQQSGVAILIVADGAGGRSGGAEAARKVVEMARSAAGQLLTHDPLACSKLLELMDRAIEADTSAGETTAVVAVVGSEGIAGASVGDSEAWIISSQGCERLTKGQVRKPMLGSGAARPVAFRAAFTEGTLLLGSDGLFKYTSAERICAAASESDLRSAAEALVKLVRLPSGALPDDVGVALCRRK
jgi:serine/threonine protein phosphatase PrpC